MSFDLFISYAREDEAIVAKLLPFFERLNVSVWTDQQIRQSEIYTHRINEVLSTCNCVLMIWSEHSAQSNYVQAECERALQDNKLVIGSMTDLELPVPFNIVQSSSLNVFDKDVTGPDDRIAWDDQGFQSVLDGIGVIIQRGDNLRKWAEAEGHEHPQPQMWEVLAASNDPLAVSAKQRATSTWFELIEMQRREGAFPVLDDIRRNNVETDTSGPDLQSADDSSDQDARRKPGGIASLLVAAGIGLLAGLFIPSPFGGGTKDVNDLSTPDRSATASILDNWVYPTDGPCSSDLTAGRIGSGYFDDAAQAALTRAENSGSSEALTEFTVRWFCADDKLILQAYRQLK